MSADPTPAEIDNKWTSGKPFVATERHCKLRWGCGKPGELFRCFSCGHKFVPGDVVRWVFTNDIPGAGGNPFVCASCDAPNEQLAADIIARRNANRNWWFR
ncbi:MAG: hypothetical protein JWO52_4089 [Gammaproteobacteria bacterium]|nr:hypothetical protein [Gammaproteobacteria bacterium]